MPMFYTVNQGVEWPEWFISAWIVYIIACVVALLAIAINAATDEERRKHDPHHDHR